MDIEEIFSEIVLIGALSYLIKSLISHFINKDFETYKIKIQEISEIEKVKFIILQEKRALVISKLYKHLTKLESSAKDLIAPFQPAGTKPEEEKAKITADYANEFIDYYSQHKIYLNNETCALIDSLIDKFRKIWIDFNYKGKITPKKVVDDPWHKCWKSITEEIPEIRKKNRRCL